MTEKNPLQQDQLLLRDALVRSEFRHKRWRALEALYRTGDLSAAKAVENGTMGFDDFDLAYEVVNLTLSHVNLIITTSVAHDPRLLAVPIGGGPEVEEYAVTAEGVINFYWKRAKGTQPLRAATQDAIIVGNGFLKVGWAHSEEGHDLDSDEFLGAAADALEEDRLLADLEGRDPEPVEKVVKRIDTHTSRVLEDEPWVEYVSPFDVFVPPHATELSNARWVAHRITRPIDEVAEQFDVDVEDLKPDSGRATDADEVGEWARRAEGDEGGEQRLGEVYRTATYFELWDLADGSFRAFQLHGDEYLEDSELPHSHVRAPFVHIRNYRPSGTEFWGFGDVENVANLQQMLNELFTLQLDNARRSGAKYFIDEEFVTDEVRAALESDEPDVVIPIKLKNQKVMQDVLHVARRHELSNDVYAAKRDIEEYLQRVLGINDFQAGGSGADRMSATAAAVVDSVASLRSADKVAAVERAAGEVGTLILLLCQEWLEEPRAIRVTNNVRPHWIEASRDEIRGEYLVEVEAGSTAQESPQARENRGMQLIREVAPTLLEYGFDPNPAIRQGLRALGYDPDLLMQKLPPPPEEGEPTEEELLAGGEGEMTEEDLLAMLSDPELVASAPAGNTVEHGGPPDALAAQLSGGPLV